VIYLVIQNIIGISIAKNLGLDAVVGLLGGSDYSIQTKIFSYRNTYNILDYKIDHSKYQQYDQGLPAFFECLKTGRKPDGSKKSDQQDIAGFHMEDKGEIKDLVDAPEYQCGQNATSYRLGDIIVTEEGYFSIQVFSQKKYENSTNNGFTGGKFHRSLFAITLTVKKTVKKTV
jgi:hypothetical protein